MNKDNSSIFFSKGRSENKRMIVKNVLQVYNEQLSAKYLGMPSDVGNSKNGSFKHLKDHMWSKVQ